MGKSETSHFIQVLCGSEKNLPAGIIIVALGASNSSQLLLELFHRVNVNKTLWQLVIHIDTSENRPLVEITMKVDTVDESLELFIMTTRSTLRERQEFRQSRMTLIQNTLVKEAK